MGGIFRSSKTIFLMLDAKIESTPIKDPTEQLANDINGMSTTFADLDFKHLKKLPTYEELLKRIFTDEKFKESRPHLFQQHTKSRALNLEQPKVTRIGGKKVLYSNFAKNCTFLNRNLNHMHDFICAELGCCANMKEDGSSLLLGNYDAKHIIQVLKKYSKKYVICRQCNSFKSELVKSNRMTFVHCIDCGSKLAVENIQRKAV